jgi:hypothetical protein
MNNKVYKKWQKRKKIAYYLANSNIYYIFESVNNTIVVQHS